MTPLWQTVLTILGSIVGTSGIMYFVMTKIVSRKMDKYYADEDERDRLIEENMFLMMERVDNAAEMTHMMAAKLHDAGIINGGLKELDDKNKELNDKYEKNLKQLARKVLSR